MFQIPIAPGEAKIPEFGGIFTSLEVRGIPLMVEMAAFEKEHLIRLLGYDKPLDIEHERLVELCEQADQKALNKLSKIEAESGVKVDEKLKKSDRV